MRLCIFLITSVFLSYGAASDFTGPKPLWFLALQVVLQDTAFVSSNYRRYCIDTYSMTSLMTGEMQLDDIPPDFKNPMPFTSEFIAQELIAQNEADYHQRDRIEETDFGRVRVEGDGFVRERAKLFEAMHTRPEIARLIEKKQKNHSSPD